MSFLKKEKKKTESPSKKTEYEDKNTSKKNDKLKVKKKVKISFGRKANKNIDTNEDNKKSKTKTKSKTQDNDIKNKTAKDLDEKEDILEEVFSEEKEIETPKEEIETKWTTSKKKKILTKDMKGKPIYLEDTGEKLGTVFDMIYDKDKNLIGYKMKDRKTDSVLSFPLDQFDQTKDGLIFVQSWYTKSVKTIEKLEFKERVSPELTTLISDDEISNEELYNIFVKHDDQMAEYIEEAISLKELLNQRLDALEKQRLALKDELMDLTEKRLIKDIDRREFSEDVTKHRHKVNVLDVNIKKCKELLKRLNNTSFGRLGIHITSNFEKKESKDHYLEEFSQNKKPEGITLTEEIENPYKQKYDDIKERYAQLQENYNELKLAVEKLVEKGEL